VGGGEAGGKGQGGETDLIGVLRIGMEVWRVGKESVHFGWRWMCCMDCITLLAKKFDPRGRERRISRAKTMHVGKAEIALKRE
jgi:hypothetical protein